MPPLLKLPGGYPCSSPRASVGVLGSPVLKLLLCTVADVGGLGRRTRLGRPESANTEGTPFVGGARPVSTIGGGFSRFSSGMEQASSLSTVLCSGTRTHSSSKSAARECSVHGSGALSHLMMSSSFARSGGFALASLETESPKLTERVKVEVSQLSDSAHLCKPLCPTARLHGFPHLIHGSGLSAPVEHGQRHLGTGAIGAG